jgi:hypothetical protein
MVVLFFVILISFRGRAESIENKENKKSENETLLQSLGIHFDETKLTSDEVERLVEEREWKLSHHRTMGHVTAGLMAASFITALAAKRNGRKGNRQGSGMGPWRRHQHLSYLTSLSYFYTAYLSLSAPKPMDFEDEHERKIHKHMAYIHFPMMVLAPILGTIAINQIDKDGEVSGIGKLARPAMYLGAISFFTAWTVMTF